MTVAYDKMIDLDRLSAFKDKCDAEYAKSGSKPDTSKGILFAQVDSTSTSTAYTAQVSGVTSYYDGLTIMLKNGVVTSESGFTLNVNNLGAKPFYTNMAAVTLDTTIFNVNYTMLIVYDSTRGDAGGWICYRGYDSNTNTIGYQLRANSGTRPAADKGYRYRLWFSSVDGQSWVPANTSTSTNATASRTPNTRAIDPFGPIIYYSTNGTTNAAANLTASACWSQYTLSLGYSFNTTGAALAMTIGAPVYVKCTPVAAGGATMDGYVQALPSTADGKVYIYLGIAYSATNIELWLPHPVYWHDGTGIRLWTGAEPTGGSSVEPSSTTPSMDGTAAVGSSAKYAREDHVHPTDTSRQAALVSGTNIKTVNGTSLLGGGNISTAELPSVTSSDNGKVLMVVSGAWAAGTIPSANGVSF